MVPGSAVGRDVVARARSLEMRIGHLESFVNEVAQEIAAHWREVSHSNPQALSAVSVSRIDRTVARGINRSVIRVAISSCASV